MTQMIMLDKKNQEPTVCNLHEWYVKSIDTHSVKVIQRYKMMYHANTKHIKANIAILYEAKQTGMHELLPEIEGCFVMLNVIISTCSFDVTA